MKTLFVISTAMVFLMCMSSMTAAQVETSEACWERKSPGTVCKEEVSGMELIWIPAGCFQMGCVSGMQCRNTEKPVHEVCLDGFWMGRYEVTQKQWQQVMGKNPSHFKEARLDRDTSNYPVEGISWNDVQKFLQKVNARVEQEMYRLPSEAEWEYAARAGTETVYSFGNDMNSLGEYAWYSKNSGDTTHPVGQLKPNIWGLYDMHGNVGEWCHDWYDATYYSHSPKENPPGPASGSGRVSRGGLWFSLDRGCRSALRGTAGLQGGDLGFRLVRTP
ncbi:MAG: formylglycine-generating enzyme family protein [bacterium]|nr:formylglycine-generating enzyme family protein [bacterium]